MGTADIQGTTGPARKVHLVLGEVDEITFGLKKQVLSVTAKDGTMSDYDLATVETVAFTRGDKDFNIQVKEKVDDRPHTEPELTRKEAGSDFTKPASPGPIITGPEPSNPITDKTGPSTNIGETKPTAKQGPKAG